ncbi:MAG: alanine racemase [Clostridia bacterium]|nr:alanine racemase [Clostridia bacterium]
MHTNFFKRIWAEIDLDAISHNVAALRSLLPQNVKMMAVVKADAYGHGVEAVTRTLVESQVDLLAVSSISEAIQLRRYERELPILILGYTPPECASQLAQYRLTQTIYSLPYAKELSAAAHEADCTVTGHLKLDVGMGRLGFRIDEPQSFDDILTVYHMKGLAIEGIFTHLPSADLDGDVDGTITHEQIEQFQAYTNRLQQQGIPFKYRHCCNSAASLAFPSGYMDLVREGIALYGLAPSNELKNKANLKPAMQLKTVVSMVKTLHKGDTISYGRTVVLEEERRVATVCIGYADGYPRQLSNKGYMLIDGKRAPILGRVCMDQLMLDVTHIDDVKMGTEVTVFGQSADVELPVEEVASLCNTIHYELVCVLGKRVPRVYRKNGQTVGVTDYIGE